MSVVTGIRREVAGSHHTALTPYERRFNDVTDDLIADLGGEDALSTAQIILVRRASMLTLQLELLDRHFLTRREDGSAGTVQLGDYQMCTNTLRRTLMALGLKRVPKEKDITPNLTTYLRGKRPGRRSRMMSEADDRSHRSIADRDADEEADE